MKVLHIIGGGDVGGAKIHVLSLIKEMNKYIDVYLISLREGQFAEDARKMNINVQVVQTGNIIKDLSRIVAIAKETNAQIIHSHGAKANMLAALSKKFTRVPLVTTMHSDYKLDYMQSLSKRLSFGAINTAALRFLDYYVAVSNNFKEMLVARNFKEDKIFTVYNGIDFSVKDESYTREAFLNKYKLNVSADDILVGFLGRLDPVKGLDTFIRAAKIVSEITPNVKFIIGGDGPQRRQLEELVVNLNLENIVIFPGWIDTDHRYEFMNAMDINTLTSLSESFPYVILEGVLYKKAIVSSNVGGVSDLIEDGVNGFLFEPGDYKKLAEHLTELCNNPSLRKTMGEKIYDKASKQFSLQNMSKTQIEIYEKIMSFNEVNNTK